ncbi:MAG: hypothetical protein ACLT40_10160 [Fusobacterium sp.]
MIERTFLEKLIDSYKAFFEEWNREIFEESKYKTIIRNAKKSILISRISIIISLSSFFIALIKLGVLTIKIDF